LAEKFLPQKHPCYFRRCRPTLPASVTSTPAMQSGAENLLVQSSTISKTELFLCADYLTIVKGFRLVFLEWAIIFPVASFKVLVRPNFVDDIR
jgi:hypothetical protein